MNEVVETQTCKIWLEDDIIHIVSLPGTEETLETAKENLAAVKKLVKNGKKPLLADMSQIKSVSREARECYSRKESEEFTSAMALIAKSAVSKVIGNFFLGLNKPPYPIKLFTSEKEAIDWLKEFIK